jgi:hypothetical protein
MVQDSRSASYPAGAAIASSYDFGSIDFFHQELGGWQHVNTPQAGAGTNLNVGDSERLTIRPTV